MSLGQFEVIFDLKEKKQTLMLVNNKNINLILMYKTGIKFRGKINIHSSLSLSLCRYIKRDTHKMQIGFQIA